MEVKKPITVVLPDHPPTLTPQAARTLLQLLRDAARDASPSEDDGEAEGS